MKTISEINVQNLEALGIDGRLFARASRGRGPYIASKFANVVQPNGNGTARLVKTRVLAIRRILVEIDGPRRDGSFLRRIARECRTVPFMLTMQDGATYHIAARLIHLRIYGRRHAGFMVAQEEAATI